MQKYYMEKLQSEHTKGTASKPFSLLKSSGFTICPRCEGELSKLDKQLMSLPDKHGLSNAFSQKVKQSCVSLTCQSCKAQYELITPITKVRARASRNAKRLNDLTLQYEPINKGQQANIPALDARFSSLEPSEKLRFIHIVSRKVLKQLGFNKVWVDVVKHSISCRPARTKRISKTELRKQAKAKRYARLMRRKAAKARQRAAKR